MVWDASQILAQIFLKRGHIDKTLFIKINEKCFQRIQTYVNDTLLGVAHESLCKEFSKLMSKEFEWVWLESRTSSLDYKWSNAKMASSSTKERTVGGKKLLTNHMAPHVK